MSRPQRGGPPELEWYYIHQWGVDYQWYEQDPPFPDINNLPDWVINTAVATRPARPNSRTIIPPGGAPPPPPVRPRSASGSLPTESRSPSASLPPADRSPSASLPPADRSPSASLPPADRSPSASLPPADSPPRTGIAWTFDMRFVLLTLIRDNELDRHQATAIFNNYFRDQLRASGETRDIGWRTLVNQYRESAERPGWQVPDYWRVVLADASTVMELSEREAMTDHIDYLKEQMERDDA